MPYAGPADNYLNPEVEDNLTGQVHGAADAATGRLPTMDPSRYAVGLVAFSLAALWLLGWRLNGV